MSNEETYKSAIESREDLKSDIGSIVEVGTVATDPNYLLLLEKFASRGLTDDAIAMMVGTDVFTFRKQRREHPEVEKAIIKGRLGLVTMIDSKVWDLAMGNYKTQTKKVIKNGRGTILEEEVSEKTLPPNIELLKLLMTNIGGYTMTQYTEQDNVKQIQNTNRMVLDSLK